MLHVNSTNYPVSYSLCLLFANIKLQIEVLFFFLSLRKPINYLAHLKMSPS